MAGSSSSMPQEAAAGLVEASLAARTELLGRRVTSEPVGSARRVCSRIFSPFSLRACFGGSVLTAVARAPVADQPESMAGHGAAAGRVCMIFVIEDVDKCSHFCSDG